MQKAKRIAGCRIDSYLEYVKNCKYELEHMDAIVEKIKWAQGKVFFGKMDQIVWAIISHKTFNPHSRKIKWMGEKYILGNVFVPIIMIKMFDKINRSRKIGPEEKKKFMKLINVEPHKISIDYIIKELESVAEDIEASMIFSESFANLMNDSEYWDLITGRCYGSKISTKNWGWGFTNGLCRI